MKIFEHARERISSAVNEVRRQIALDKECSHNFDEYGVYATDVDMFTVARTEIRLKTWKSGWGENLWCRATVETPYNRFGMELKGAKVVGDSFRHLDVHSDRRGLSYSDPGTKKKNS